mgnify:CR=1 FL=1
MKKPRKPKESPEQKKARMDEEFLHSEVEAIFAASSFHARHAGRSNYPGPKPDDHDAWYANVYRAFEEAR